MSKPTVFISYSHKDEVWKDALKPHLKMLEQVGYIVLWDDRKIDTGGEWEKEIRAHMKKAAVVVCLISANYLASDFVTKEEVPFLLERKEKEGMPILPILIKPCAWKAVPWLKKLQMRPTDNQSLAIHFKDKEDEIFTQVAEQIYEIITDPDYTPPPPSKSKWDAIPQDRISIHRLPETGAALFGRNKELELLDQAWESETTNVVSLVAWGGVGKSTLVKKWVEGMAVDNYRGATRVFAWSFYSQGTGERITSADLFITEALEFFGDLDPKSGSAWEKGERLAALINEEKTLLILDGLEPLQEGMHVDKGRIKDPALSVLLKELARENRGLCLISTREEVADLKDFPETAMERSLEQISPEAGRALLRVERACGTDAELEEASRDFGNHALAVNLLAAYLHGIPGHSITYASEIPDLDIPEEKGKHSRRVMEAFWERFGQGPERELLLILGLFDRPAEGKAVKTFRTGHAIPGLTDQLQKLSEPDWNHTLETLRKTKLLAQKSEHRPDTLDSHPLVREHFGEKFQRENTDGWKEAHGRLYEYYKGEAKELPDTLEEMAPLYLAVGHGCKTGRQQDAFDEVYWERIARRGKYFSVRKLGAFGSDLAVLAGFLDTTWISPGAGLSENNKALVLNLTGSFLRSLGRLEEAVQPMEAGMETYISHASWQFAAIAAGNLSELFLDMGEVPQAVEYGQKCMELADQSGNAIQEMARRSTLADALYQAGKFQEAEDFFNEAEEIQKKVQPEYPLLYSLSMRA